MAVLPDSPAESLDHRLRALLLLDCSGRRRRLHNGRSRRVSICGHVLPPPERSNLVNDQGDDQAENDQRRPEDPDGLRHTATGDTDGVGRAHSAKHDNGVAAHGDVLSQMGGTEEVDEVVANDGIVVRTDRAEEHDDIMVRLVRDMHIAEEDDYVMVDVTLGVHAAEEADGIVERVTFRDVDVAAKLHGVLFGSRRGGSQQQCRGEQERGEPTMSHG